jgi:phosphatidylserine/phosphatidylglycerophosphate/cardiolipin synthase-like enzyme
VIKVNVDDIYRWIAETLEQHGVLSESQLCSTLGVDELDHVLLLLNYLVSRKLATVKVTGNEREYQAVNIKKIKELAGAEARPVQEPIAIPDFALVVNVPLSLEPSFQLMKARHQGLNILTMRQAFKLLILSAGKELRLALPFLELDGLSYFVDEFEEAARANVHIKVLSRGLLEPETPGFSYLSKLRAFAKLLNIYDSAKTSPSASIAIRDCSTRVSNPTGGSLHYEGIHQKMVVADDRCAYVGSGEIRAASFLMNGEVGVIQSGNEARFWVDYFDLFWNSESSREVPESFFERALK